MFVQRISQAVRKRPKKVYSFFAFGLLLLLGSSFLLSSLIIKGFHAHASQFPPLLSVKHGILPKAELEQAFANISPLAILIPASTALQLLSIYLKGSSLHIRAHTPSSLYSSKL